MKTFMFPDIFPAYSKESDFKQARLVSFYHPYLTRENMEALTYLTKGRVSHGFDDVCFYVKKYIDWNQKHFDTIHSCLFFINCKFFKRGY